MPDLGLTQLRGTTVVLRDWRLGDLGPHREWLRPHHEWHARDGPYFPPPTDDEADDACAGLRRQIISAQWPSPRTSLVVADPVSDILIGRVSWYFESEESDWRRIGVVLYDTAVRSRGRGTEAVRLRANHLFSTSEIVRLDFATWSGNTAMCRVGTKLGLAEEARFREARVVREQRYDGVVYGVLRAEWQDQSGQSAASATDRRPAT